MPLGFASDHECRFAGEEFDQLGFGDAKPALQLHRVKLPGLNPSANGCSGIARDFGNGPDGQSFGRFDQYLL